MSRNNLFAAVDMGATKTMVLVGESARGRLNLLGCGEAPAAGGVQRGIIVDTKAALDSLRTAFAAAEKSAGAPYEVRRSYFAVAGPHVIGRADTGLASIANSCVTADELRRATADARLVRCPGERSLLDIAAQSWRVDGHSVPDCGLGATGRKFEIEFWRTEADTNELRRMAALAANIGAPLERFIPAAQASAVIATTVQERLEGVLVVDLGASLSDTIAYRDGRILLAESLPFGGDDLTAELARLLRMRPDDAETLKRTQARARLLPEHKGTRQLFAPGEGVIGARQVRAEDLHGLLEKRLREQLETLRDRVRAASDPGRPISHVVLTGGACALPGLGELAGSVLGMRCERLCEREWVGEPVSEPRHSTARGVLELAHDDELHAARIADLEQRTPGALRRLWNACLPKSVR